MLKYKFKDQIIKIGDVAANALRVGFPRETSVEVENFSEENKGLEFCFDGYDDVFVVKPIGKHASVSWDDHCPRWENMELIVKKSWRNYE